MLPGHKILVIDDDSLLLHLMEQILECAGEEVLLANNGPEGMLLN
jgi:CheY-like chemotaxis protein